MDNDYLLVLYTIYIYYYIYVFRQKPFCKMAYLSDEFLSATSKKSRKWLKTDC